MIEVHTGARPGNPRRLLILTAGILCASLGLAWAQTRLAASLQPEQRIGTTPLMVRVPQGWAPQPNQRGVFTPSRERSLEDTPLRMLRFSYERRSQFTPIEAVLPEVADGAGQEARVAGYAGVEVRRREPLAFRMPINRDLVIRVVALPRGDLIRVEYSSLTELRLADMQQLDDICQAIRIDESGAGDSPAALLESAGVRGELPTGWRACGPDLPSAAGVFLQPDEARPTWALGLLRSWPTERSPEELLRSVAATRFPEAQKPLPAAASSRRDGLTVHRVALPPARGRSAAPSYLAEARLLSQGDERAILLVFATAGSAAAARAGADVLTAQLSLARPPGWPDLVAARAAATELMEALRAGGLRRHWGDEPAQQYFLGFQDQRLLAGLELRRRWTRAGGYEGSRLMGFDRGFDRHLEAWRMDDEGVGYQYAIEISGRGRREAFLEVAQQRDATTRAVETLVTLPGAPPQKRSFVAAPHYAAPPLRRIIEEFAARPDAAPAYLFQVSTFDGAAAELLLRRIDAGGGRQGVLGQLDYLPRGALSLWQDGQWWGERGPGLEVDERPRAIVESEAPFVRSHRFPPE